MTDDPQDRAAEIARLVGDYKAHHPSMRDPYRCGACLLPFHCCEVRRRAGQRLVELGATDALLPGYDKAARQEPDA